MKRAALLAGLLSILSLIAFASSKDQEDFPLQVHIVRVDMAQGQSGVSGSGSTDNNGNYNSEVSGGESYLYHVYTIRVDGDSHEFTMTSPRMRGFMKSGFWLHMGNYKGRWNKNGSLEIQFHPDSNKDELKHEPFTIRAEKQIEASLSN
jgi:hypothetical protein